MSHNPSLYLAGPLFSEAERSFNRKVKERLSNAFSVYLPQEDGLLMPDLLAEGNTIAAANSRVFEADLKAIQSCAVLVIIMDGRTIDEGAAFELGVAYTLGKTCVGLQTDFRRLAAFGNNPMIEVALLHTCCSIEDLETWLYARFNSLTCSRAGRGKTTDPPASCRNARTVIR